MADFWRLAVEYSDYIYFALMVPGLLIHWKLRKMSRLLIADVFLYTVLIAILVVFVLKRVPPELVTGPFLVLLSGIFGLLVTLNFRVAKLKQ